MTSPCQATTRIAARQVWTPAGLRPDTAVVLDATQRVLHVGPATREDDLLDGILLPGLVNAHCHLELSHHRRPVGTARLGSPDWVGALFESSVRPTDVSVERGARAARALGTAFLIDTSNSGTTAAAMAAARLRGTVQVECLGLARTRWAPALEAAHAVAGAPGVSVRPTAHAPISCAPELLAAALAPSAVPATLHCDEDPADSQLLSHRRGPWADFHTRLATHRPPHPWREALGSAASGVALLERLELLRPSLGLVHLTAAGPLDLDRITRAGCTAVLCPRSNLHITGELPDVRGMVDRGIPLAIGTDSTASSPDLDLLAEAATLRAAFPELPVQTWLHALTSGGARLLPGRPVAGRLDEGARPDLLLVEVPPGPDPLERLLDGTRWPRRWLT